MGRVNNSSYWSLTVSQESKACLAAEIVEAVMLEQHHRSIFGEH
jgi:hypothetical protein